MYSRPQKSIGVIFVSVSCFVLIPAAKTSAASPFSEIVSFGNSMDVDLATNGLSWTSWLASELDAPASSSNGKNYWQGCALTSSLSGQASAYLRAHTPDDSTLITLPAAPGDVSRACISGRPPIETTIWGVEQAISRLAEAGGKHFILPRVPYAELPTMQMDHEQIVQINTSIDELLPQWEQTHEVSIYRPDFYQLSIDIAATPSEFGFTHIDRPIGGAPNPHEYAYWDAMHPSTAFDRLIGHMAFQTLGLATAPDAVTLGLGQTSYQQGFESLARADLTTPLPDGWVGVTDGAMYATLTGRSMTRVGASGSLIGAGPQNDRALGLGVTTPADENEIQFYAELADSDYGAIRLQFDLEAWGSNTHLAAETGEAAFHVVLETGRSDGYAPLIDFGTVTTGVVLESVSQLDGNAPENRFPFDSGVVPVELAGDSQLRLRWIVPGDSQTTGWTFGLDNFELTLLGNLRAGDADQDKDFDQIDLVQVQIGGKYLSGERATWGEGDWNGAPGGAPGSPPAGDGRFNQLDIVDAQQAGIYLTGPYASEQRLPTDTDLAAVSIPEPTSLLLLVLAVLTLLFPWTRSQNSHDRLTG